MTDSTPETDPLTLLDDLLKAARAAGADQADAMMYRSADLSIGVRLGSLEKLERAESRDLGLRVLVGKSQAIVSSNDFDPAMLRELAERAVATAKSAPEDPYCGIADAADLVTDIPDIDIFDPAEPTAESLIEMAKQAEDSGRATQGITNSEGAEAGWGSAIVALAATNGLARSYRTSGAQISASMLAGEGTGMERDYDYASRVYLSDLPPPEEIGRSAAERAIRRLGARKMETAEVPVIYDARVAGGLVRHFAGAANGASVARGTSFLKDRMGEQIFASGITITDDPHRSRGLRSKPFDAEGLPNRRRDMVKDGVLESWFLDLASARQLDLVSTGHASRGTSGPPSPSPTNLFMEAGTTSPEALMTDIDQGLFITELIGMGVNGITGDYSRGATGFWIEGGKISFPVHEMTVAGNLKDMFLSMTPADDLTFQYGTDAPTIRIDGMTVAGG